MIIFYLFRIGEPHCFFRGYPLYKFNDYIAHGTRQQYWEEPFTKAVMEGIQDRELDLKKGAELLGVSYRFVKLIFEKVLFFKTFHLHISALCTVGTASATVIWDTLGRGTIGVQRRPWAEVAGAAEQAANGGKPIRKTFTDAPEVKMAMEEVRPKSWSLKSTAT